MYSIKSSIDILGTASFSKSIKVQGLAVFNNNISGVDVDFRNATFNIISASGEINSPEVNVTGNINVDGNIIGGDHTHAYLPTLEADDIVSGSISSVNIINSESISSKNITNSENISSQSISNMSKITTNSLDSFDISSSGSNQSICTGATIIVEKLD